MHRPRFTLTALLMVVSPTCAWAQLTLPFAGGASVNAPAAAFQITNSGTGYAVLGLSDWNGIGVGGICTATFGFNYGIWGESASPDGTGVYGLASANSGSTFGGQFFAASPAGTGVYAQGSAAGAWFDSSDDNGVGVGAYASGAGSSVGGLFQSDGASGYGVVANATGTSGATYGGYFTNSSTSGTAVLGQAGAASGTTYGVHGTTYAPAGAAVFGKSYASTGSPSALSGECQATGASAVQGRNLGSNNFGYIGTGTYGVYAVANAPAGMGVRGDSLTSNSGVGVYGRSTNSLNGYGVYSAGRFGATGTKSFQIDHPLDPENKYLSHYCTEGPEPLNVYRGNVMLNAAGEAWVALPDYFAAINRDPTYQLTAVGGAAPNLHVAQPIADNRFLIGGGSPGLQVSWRVEAVRNDLFVRAYGAPAEAAKPAEWRGTYLQPELYGQPAERGQFYCPPAGTLASGRQP